MYAYYWCNIQTVNWNIHDHPENVTRNYLYIRDSRFMAHLHDAVMHAISIPINYLGWVRDHRNGCWRTTEPQRITCIPTTTSLLRVSDLHWAPIIVKLIWNLLLIMVDKGRAALFTKVELNKSNAWCRGDNLLLRAFKSRFHHYTSQLHSEAHNWGVCLINQIVPEFHIGCFRLSFLSHFCFEIFLKTGSQFFLYQL